MNIIQLVNEEREDLGLYLIPEQATQIGADLTEVFKLAFKSAPDNPEDYLQSYYGIKRLFVSEMIQIKHEIPGPAFFRIDGYWKDTKDLFIGNLVKSTHDQEDDDMNDEAVFFYGLDVHTIKECISLGENSSYDFVITSYHETVPPWESKNQIL